MNIVISGPYGLGSLSDEAVLAGLLARLAGAHAITVLTSNPERVAAAHPIFAASAAMDDNGEDDDEDDEPEAEEEVRAKKSPGEKKGPEHILVQLPGPGSLLSTPRAWNAMAKGHALVLASAGTISDAGNPPARVWLSQLEHGRTAGVKTALVGIGARPAPDARERARIQRFLHNFTECLSARDDTTKEVVCEYGMSPSRISNNGSPALALASVVRASAPATPVPGRIGIVLTPRVPSRDEFGFEAAHLSGHVAAPMAKLIGDLLAQPGVSVTLFHDDTPPMESAIHALIPASAAGRVTALSPAQPIEKLRESMAGCEVVFSCSLHGLMLAATAGVPVIGLQAETGAREFLRTLMPESDTWLLPSGADGAAFDAAFALQRIAAARTGAAGLREFVGNKLKVLLRKEAQNGRMLELLVPRRDRRTDRGPIGGGARRQYDDDESEEAPRPIPPHRRKAGVKRGWPR